MKPANRIHLCLAKMSPDGMEQKYVQEAFDTNWVAPLGPNVDAFEKELECYLNSKIPAGSNHSILNYHNKVAVLSSCTAAIHIALMLLGVKEGDEVICQSMSFCASSNPVVYCGAKPIFVDSEKETWNMSPELLETAIKDRIAKTGRKPKAIIVVDLYGMPADWEAIEGIARRYEVPIIEDAANALGSTYNGRPCGTFGDIATLSFNGNKMITTSGGGAIICKDEATKKRAVFLATQAKEPCLHYEHEMIGYNYRMSNICAGVGRGQMTVLDEHIRHHKHVHELYQELFPNVEVHGNPSGHYESNFWLTTITFKKEVDVEAICKVLDQQGIEARPVWKPMHKQPVYKDCPAYVNGVSEAIFKVGMCLPSGPYVSDEDVMYIVNCIKNAIA
ncbi:MAG: aminotransferase class I/II-fold pyridoxal phosphate-dependent enzyme [Bacteroidales bacterium]|nr:aminotransferase class I/II-fold pyridoxal phosphate-dependent enzyme [Bacteroidales bacterium]